MRTTIQIILICVIFFLIAQPTISWPPLKIKFAKALLSIGMFLIMAGVVCIILQGHTEAYSKGLKKGAELEQEAAIEVAKQLIQESKNEHNGNHN